jgi:DnaK suppressor protein
MPRTTKSSAAAVPTSSRAAASRASKPAPQPAAKRPAAPKSTAAKAPAAPKKAASRKTVEAEAAPVDKFLQEQHSLLMTERATYLHQAESLKAEAEQLAAEMEPGDIQFDEESGEGGTMNVERERDLALSAQARAAVDEIDRALAKIGAGTYGICERCGEPIKKARLKALPYAALCIECKSGGLSRR